VTSTLSIARDFSRYPAGRYKTDGPFPGELCRRKLLVPALRDSDSVLVELDGTRGYGSSFLEEAFGGLIREEGFDLPTLKHKLLFKSSDPTLVEEIWTYMQDAQEDVEDDTKQG
jgi:hypothetical protein